MRGILREDPVPHDDWCLCTYSAENAWPAGTVSAWSPSPAPYRYNDKLTCLILITGHLTKGPLVNALIRLIRRRQPVEPMKKGICKRDMLKNLQMQNPPRFRISGIREGIATLQMAEVLDLTLKGALVEHHGMFQPQTNCFLQLGANGDLSTIRCRLLQSRVSRNEGGGLCYRTRVEFLDLSPAAEEALMVFIRSSQAHGSWSGGGP